jgi:hypothetical protein
MASGMRSCSLCSKKLRSRPSGNAVALKKQTGPAGILGQDQVRT